MNENFTKRYALLAQKVIKGLESRQMTGYYAADKEEALKIALSLIPEGSTVTMGGAMSAHEIGLPRALEEGDYNFIDRDKMEDKRAAMLAAYDADYFLASANAITEDGILVNIDGNANRVSAIAYGPKKVIFIVGMNMSNSIELSNNSVYPNECTIPTSIPSNKLFLIIVTLIVTLAFK